MIKLWRTQSNKVQKETDMSIFNSKLFDSPLFTVATGDSTPAMDILDRANEYEIRVAAPGATKDIEVNIENGYLNIEICRETEPENSENTSETFAMRGIKDFCFKRRVSLANSRINLDEISSVYKNGILTIVLPKTAEAQPKKIPVSLD